MTIGSVASNNLSQTMAATLAQLQAATQADGGASFAGAAASASTTSNALTGPSTASLSDQVLNTLVMMQAEGSGASTGSNPVQQAFASLDSNGDGSISQSELENGVENVGGTAGEADTIFSALGGTSTSGISEDQFADAAQAGGTQQAAGMHHHHHAHHAGGGGSQSSATSDTSQQDDSADEFFAELASGSSGSTSATSTSTATASTGSTSGTNSLVSSLDSWLNQAQAAL